MEFKQSGNDAPFHLVCPLQQSREGLESFAGRDSRAGSGEVSVGDPGPGAWEPKNWPSSLLQAASGELDKAALESSTRWQQLGRVEEQTSPASIQSYELVHSNIHHIYELLEHVKEMNLEIHDCRILIT